MLSLVYKQDQLLSNAPWSKVALQFFLKTQNDFFVNLTFVNFKDEIYFTFLKICRFKCLFAIKQYFEDNITYES